MEKVRQKEWIVFCAVCLVFLLCAMMEYRLPGVYMDAVNPDYLAAKGRFSGINTEWIIAHQPGFSFLGNWYHGYCTLYWGLPLYRLLGTNLFSLRFSCTLSGLSTLALVYLIIRRLSGWKWAASGTVLLAVSFVFGFSYRTQQYIVMWGMIPLLGAIYFALRYWDDQRAVWAAVCGGLAGLAFYDYFVFAFFAPVFVCFFAWKRFRHAFVWLGGFAVGAVLYVLGYASYMTAAEIPVPFYPLCAGIFLMYGLGFFVIYLIQRAKTKRGAGILMGGALAVLALLGVAVLLMLRSQIAQKGVIPDAESMRARLGLLKRFMVDVSHGYSITEMMYQGYVPDVYGNLRNAVLIAAILLWGVFCRKELGFFKALFLICFPVSFCLVALVLINRMGAHHFSVMVPFYYLILTVLVSQICKKAENRMRRAAFALTGIVFAGIFAGNMISGGVILKELRESGGRNRYTEQITVLAEEAKASPDDVYLFPEWGFFMPFAFLTGDEVLYFAEFTPETVVTAPEGRNAYVLLWSRDQVPAYEEILKPMGGTLEEEKIYRTRDGEEVFYRYTVKLP